MKKYVKRVLSALLVVVMFLCAAPLSGFVGLSLPEWFTFKSKAAESHRTYNSVSKIS